MSDRPLRPVYQIIAARHEAIANCIKANNTEWQRKHAAVIAALVKEYLPSGSGVDSGTTFDDKLSNASRLVFHCSYHHMDGSGMYSGWTEHTITVKPSLAHGFELRIGGLNHNDIKEYLGEIYQHALSVPVQEDSEIVRKATEAG